MDICGDIRDSAIYHSEQRPDVVFNIQYVFCNVWWLYNQIHVSMLLFGVSTGGSCVAQEWKVKYPEKKHTNYGENMQTLHWKAGARFKTTTPGQWIGGHVTKSSAASTTFKRILVHFMLTHSFLYTSHSLGVSCEASIAEQVKRRWLYCNYHQMWFGSFLKG